MKYLIIIITASLISVALSFNAEAQILNRLKKKAQQAAEQKAEEKLTEKVEQAAQSAVERSWNSIFGEWEADSSGRMRVPFSMNSNIETEDRYSFKTITTMEVQSVDKNGKEEPPLYVDMHFSDNNSYTGTKFHSREMENEGGDLFIIYDLKNEAKLMLMENEGNKFSFGYKWDQYIIENGSLTQSDSNWEEIEEWRGYTKIGNKNILGYNCDGYQSQTDEETVEVWVSHNNDFGMPQLFKAQANAKQMRGKIPEDYPHGMVMEMHTKNLKNGEKITMKITRIDKDADISYSMAEYPTMSFGNKSTNK